VKGYGINSMVLRTLNAGYAAVGPLFLVYHHREVMYANATWTGLDRRHLGCCRRYPDLFPDSAAKTARAVLISVDSQAESSSVSCHTVRMAKKRTKADKLQRNVDRLATRDEARRDVIQQHPHHVSVFLRQSHGNLLK
jgi:hypothetical protein